MQKKTHLLIRRAKSLPIRRTTANLFTDASYDEVQGLWVNTESHVPLAEDPNRPKPMTKKADVETGEDAKGT